MKQCIENPNDVDWVSFWAERLDGKVNKNWDEAAPGFYKRTKKPLTPRILTSLRKKRLYIKTAVLCAKKVGLY